LVLLVDEEVYGVVDDFGEDWVRREYFRFIGLRGTIVMRGAARSALWFIL
jgi:hypothetical protein